jgi:ABC-2 type transport system ATP-binding protein
MNADPSPSAAPPGSPAPVEAVGVSKWYGPVTALSDVSVRLEPGVWGLLGPNGSGKTTLLMMLAGQLRPSLGAVRVFGERPFANPRALARIGLCPEADALLDDVSGLELVTNLARLSGFSRGEARDRAAAALDAFQLGDAIHRKVGGYSRGMRQRAKLAQAVVHDPALLLLDEPLTGTDPVSRRIILDELARRAEAGALVLFSTHVLHEVESLTDRVLLLSRGQLVARGSVSEIREVLHEHPHQIYVEVSHPRKLAVAVLGDPAGGVRGARIADEGTVVLEASQPEAAYAAIARAILADSSLELVAMTSPDATLEAVFHALVERSSRMAGTGADAGVGRARELSARGKGPPPPARTEAGA